MLSIAGYTVVVALVRFASDVFDLFFCASSNKMVGEYPELLPFRNSIYGPLPLPR